MGLSPVRILLNSIRQRTTIRWAFLDKNHSILAKRNIETRLEAILRRLLARIPSSSYAYNRLLLRSLRTNKERIIMELKNRPPNMLRIWSDGSRLKDSKVGWSMAMFKGYQFLYQ